jgi:patatin-like phospholipase/acyl hydrolase
MSKLLRILSIDGGGIRGIIPGMLLSSLETYLQEASGNPDARLSDHFDLVAGTSTGGILTCIYLCPGSNGKPRFSASNAVDLYLEHGRKMFHTPVTPAQISKAQQSECRYLVKGMNALLRTYFSDLRLSQLLKPCLVTSFDMENSRSFFFTQHDARKSNDYDFYVKDVTRATSAAPGYFEPARIKSIAGKYYTLLDGGVFANNPALCAYAEATQLFGSGNVTPGNMLMVSLGSGVFRNEEHEKKTNKIEHSMAGVTETVDSQVKQLFEAPGHADNYFRFEPNLGTASHDLDDCSDNNLQALQDAGAKAVKEYEGELRMVANLLLTGERGLRRTSA